MKRFIIIGLTVGLVAVLSLTAYAHYTWLTADKYFSKGGEEITIYPGWGHIFPEDGVPKAERLDKFYFIDPDGKEMPLGIKPKKEGKGIESVKAKLEKEGTYLAVLKQKSGFSCKTTKGYLFGKSKKELKGVLESKWSEGSAKTIINVGSPQGKGFQQEIDQRFQIVPLDDPGKLKEGDYFRVKIVFKDTPKGHKAKFVYATYVGFSDEKDTYCYATKPDKNGIAKIKIMKRGIWLIYAFDEMPYPRPEEADKYSFVSTLTFEIK